MFVTQKEIEARLASDENLLNIVLSNNLSGRPSGDCEKDTNSAMDRDDESESLQESDLNTASVDPSVDTSTDTDTKLQRILDEVEFDQELRDSDYDFLGERNESGRPKGAADRTTEQRADIALMGSVLGHGLAADLLGISTASSSLHARGKVNHEDDIDFELDKVVKRKLHKIRNKSADALIKVLDSADSNLLYDTIKSPKDAVFVANQLASVIQKVQPQEREEKPTAQFVIIQPTVRSIEQYEVINV